MTKNPRDPRVWTNEEIQDDSAGYLAAQQAFREDQEKAKREAAIERKKADYVERLCSMGLSKQEAEAAWRQKLIKEADQEEREAQELEHARRQLARRL